MQQIHNEVGCWAEQVIIPTYMVGEPEKHPMFFEKRVYQGSSGKVYPYPVIETIKDEKVDVPYEAVFLENDYLRIMILPQLGGRIQRAYDKTIGYDFVYYNEVIKPALVGLLGPWISGGIEFNWPQHHRPTTFAPVDWRITSGPEGKKTVQLSEVDQMYGTKAMAGISLYPDRAYIEIEGQLYNGRPIDQTFLWWANPAVAVNDETQSIFPPDVTAVFDHGKRDVSSFPIAHSVYYKHSYEGGVDISRYKNIPVPTSYMAWRSSYDFVGGYDYGKQAGILHIADHHISPGKKQWTWGCGDFGRAWDRNLTDENGPYIELMTGVFTDNQPDFSWLKPFEEKTFTQYFMPYHRIGAVKNASKDLVLGMEKEDGLVKLRLYAASTQPSLVLQVKAADTLLFSEPFSMQTGEYREWKGSWAASGNLAVSVIDSQGRVVLSYQEGISGTGELPQSAKAALPPSEISSCEELWLTAQHLEQYRHATFFSEAYYLEGLRRDSGDSRINNSYGLLLFRRFEFAQSESHFRRAVERLQWKNPNPQDSEPMYHLALSLLYQGKEEEAYGWFSKSTWSKNQQEMAFFHLACLAARKKQYPDALAFIERSLVKNSHNLHALFMKAKLLSVLGDEQGCEACIRQTESLDPFAYATLLLRPEKEEVLKRMGSRLSSYLESASLYTLGGWFEEALSILSFAPQKYGAVHYYRAKYQSCLKREYSVALLEGAKRDWGLNFANSLEDLQVLQFAIKEHPQDYRAAFQLGNLLYDRRRHDDAISCWESALAANPSFPLVWRNLALAYYNQQRRPEKALEALERAFALDRTDSRVCMELDQLYKKLGYSPSRRLAFLSSHSDLVSERDDLYTEYVTLHNLTGQFGTALDLMMDHRFHPWEGGEGKITREYITALSGLAWLLLGRQQAEEARSYLLRALVFPPNLGEGKLEGQKDNDVYYLLGLCERMLGNEEQARVYLQKAAFGSEKPSNMMYYNDQPADMIFFQGLARQAIGDERGARERFSTLAAYAQEHLDDRFAIDYFAVSLPDLQIFEDDLTLLNKLNCTYLLGLGLYGLGRKEEGRAKLAEVLSTVPCHADAAFRRIMLV